MRGAFGAGDLARRVRPIGAASLGRIGSAQETITVLRNRRILFFREFADSPGQGFLSEVFEMVTLLMELVSGLMVNGGDALIKLAMDIIDEIPA